MKRQNEAERLANALALRAALLNTQITTSSQKQSISTAEAAIANINDDMVFTTDPRLSDARTPVSHTHDIAELTVVSPPNDGNSLVYSTSTGKWVPSGITDGGNF
jgi:hypothetical protein